MKEFKFPDNFNPGAFPNRYDSRDFQAKPLMAAMGIEEVFDWGNGWDSEAELGIKVKIEHQDGSSSCTGQATSSLGSLLNCVETSKLEDFSAKGVYAQIYLPNGGAYPRDAMGIAVNQGFILENELPSYENGQPPSETFMRRAEDITPEMREKAKIYQALRYYALPINIDQCAIAIKNFWGIKISVSGSTQGWITADPRPPKSGETTWGHDLYALAAFMRNGKKILKIPNSWGTNWGDKGYCYLNEDYFASGRVWTPYVLIDQKNITIKDMFECIKLNTAPEFYIKLEAAKILQWIGGWESYQKMLKSGIVKPVAEVASLPEGYIIDKSPFGYIL